MEDIEALRRYYSALLPYYDASLADRGDLQFWDSIARRWGSKHILELGCGTGRVTGILSRCAKVTAVDVLFEMIRVASQRAPEADLVVADLREFVFRSHFELVILADDPTAHLTATEERMRVFQSISDHLAPNGRVVLEGLYRSPEGQPHVASNAVRDDGRSFAVEEWWTPAGGDSTWNVTYRYTEASSVVEVASVVRSWTQDDISAIRDAGLRIECLWGDFDERPFTEDSPRVVIVATKQ